MTRTPGTVHGTHPEEQQRLSDLNTLAHQAWPAELAPRWGGRRAAAFWYTLRRAEGVRP